jgi:iron complex outermembrane receptor protein/outer membrane receptor for ferrienterochelin and colicins
MKIVMTALLLFQFSFVLAQGHEDSSFVETEEITVSSTRISRNIEDVPTRVETISQEEVEEKANMEPANVVMLLHESTGINTQQTSAVSGSTNIKIQGLDGRYTQILKDGYPLYSGFSEGLSIMQIPPLDLKQVEIIKGPASTLYGGGAIAGMINFISIPPKLSPEYTFFFNVESFGGYDAGVFFTGRNKKIGSTILLTGTYKNLYDVDDDGFTEIPKTKAFGIFPKLFFYINKKTTLSAGINIVYEDREGGDITLIKGKADSAHTYFEQNVSGRYNVILGFDKTFDKKRALIFKASGTLFNRKIERPAYIFDGTQFAVYSELSYMLQTRQHTLITGINFVSDNFSEEKIHEVLRNYDHYNAGIFVQDNWDISEKTALEAGLRYDYQNKYGSFVLPKISFLGRFTDKLAFRVGGGLGYKVPTIFTDDAEELGFKNVLPVSSLVKAETSIGGSLDFNYSSEIAKNFVLSVNQLFYYTKIRDPIVLNADDTSYLFYRNAIGNINSRGYETNIRLVYDPYKFFIGYTFTEAQSDFDNIMMPLVLVPKHKLGLVLLYERHEELKIGVESYLTGKQYLSNGSRTPAVWVAGVFAQKYFGYFSVYVNFENVTDTRQSKYSPVVNPPYNNPTFNDVWTHAEGFYFNGGIKIKL